ncbi:DUF4179 domain-containing protein [Heyndrickxia sp. NPDC080065]|uniref:DUF4179 domain-containing protein n=1 Tax=Heyndrickxia sp. NPDC080065 TaxID=3390568 RepID=UPI003CFE1B1F
MFEKEEKKIADWQEKYEHIDIPMDKIDRAIHLGFEEGKSAGRIMKRKRKVWIWPSIAVAVLFLGLLTCIRVSPTFATYISSIPGMEKIVELIRDNKGLLAAVENNYAQEIGVSQEKNGMKLTINSVIADEQGIVIFYTINTKEKQKRLQVENVDLRTIDGKKLPEGYSSFGSPAENDIKSYTDSIEYFFKKPIKQQDFKLNMKVKTSERSESFSMKFSINRQEKTSQIYELNKTVEMGGQKIKVKKVTIYPLRVAVHLELNPNNTKKILDFQDLRLVDQNGEVWSKIINGVSGRDISDSESIIYLQSNYFSKPKELYLVMNKIQAIDKDESYVLVDTEKQQILKQPKGNILSILELSGSNLIFTLNTKKKFNYDIFGLINDAKGNKFYSERSFIEDLDENKKKFGLGLPSKNYTNPLKIELNYYPSWIEGNIKLRVK